MLQDIPTDWGTLKQQCWMKVFVLQNISQTYSVGKKKVEYMLVFLLIPDLYPAALRKQICYFKKLNIGSKWISFQRTLFTLGNTLMTKSESSISSRELHSSINEWIN